MSPQAVAGTDAQPHCLLSVAARTSLDGSTDLVPMQQGRVVSNLSESRRLSPRLQHSAVRLHLLPQGPPGPQGPQHARLPSAHPRWPRWPHCRPSIAVLVFPRQGHTASYSFCYLSISTTPGHPASPAWIQREAAKELSTTPAQPSSMERQTRLLLQPLACRPCLNPSQLLTPAIGAPSCGAISPASGSLFRRIAWSNLRDRG